MLQNQAVDDPMSEAPVRVRFGSEVSVSYVGYAFHREAFR